MLRPRFMTKLCHSFDCVTDVKMETVSEDEVYDLQFGLSFEQQALDLEKVERDDYAIEIANMDE